MKKLLVIFAILISFFTSSAYAEQFVLVCKIKISSINMQTNKIMNSFMLDRYFIVDTVLQGVYDANNNPLIVNEFNDSTLTFTKKEHFSSKKKKSLSSFKQKMPLYRGNFCELSSIYFISTILTFLPLKSKV